MQPLSATALRAFDEGVALQALPQVIVEWNQNRFASSVTAFVDDPKQEKGEPEDKLYPIESIVWANRPKRGMVKGRVNEGKTSNPSTGVTYRTVSKSAFYKYWQSSTQSGTVLNQNVAGYQILNASPSITYGAQVKTNKIVIKLENSWAAPQVFQIQIKTVANPAWTTIVSNPAATADGVIELYLQNNGSWLSSVVRDNETFITGIQLRVESLNRPAAHLSVIELSARLEKDISADVISCNVQKTLQEADIASPVGTNSANAATVSLDNSDRKYDIKNTAGPYFGLLDSNAEVRIAYGINTTAFGVPGFEYIKQGTYYTNSWATDTENMVVTLDCLDLTKFLADIKVVPVLFQNKTAPVIVKELLRRAGMNNFNYIEDSTEPTIPYVWFNEDETVWSSIQSICRASQGIVFVDENNVIQYVSKKQLFDRPEAWRLLGRKVTPKEANIINTSHDFDTVTNKVNVTYSPTISNKKKVRVQRKTPDAGGKTPVYFDATGEEFDLEYEYVETPINSVLWQPEGTVALQSARLRKNMTATGTSVWIPEENAATWPHQGQINIEGEIVRFTGKVYKSFKNGTARYQTLTSEEQRKAIDFDSDELTRSQNRYTGELKNVLRGYSDTKATSHTVDIQGWNHYIKTPTNTIVTGAKSVRQEQSSLVLVNNVAPGSSAPANYESYLMSSRGAVTDKYNVYGCRMRFAVIQSQHATAGIFFHQQADQKSGYYVEFNTTNMATKTLGGRVGNVRVYRMYADGSRKHLPNSVADGGDDSKWTYGLDYNIVAGQWFNVDVTYEKEVNRFILYVNGVRVVDWIDEYASPLTQGNWGVFTRGNSGALFEYFYINNTLDDKVPDIEDSKFFHKIQGGFTSGYADREVQRSSKKKVDWFFDEFGPYCHEVREFDVKHDKFPSIRPYLYLSNDWDAFLMNTSYSPFGAKFTIANAGRDIAVLNGEDNGVVFGETVQQKMMLYGQLVIAEETKQKTVKSEEDIRKRGEVALDVESKWIQTESHAENYGQFIADKWGEPADNLTAEVFINPALQVGDVVTIDWPLRFMDPATHKYHVTGIDVAYQNGIRGTVTLRRAR